MQRVNFLPILRNYGGRPSLKMTEPQQDPAFGPFIPEVGARIRQMLNGIKCALEDMEPTFADLHPGLDIATLRSVVEGKIPPSKEILAAIRDHPPLRVRDLYRREYQHLFPVVDDTVDGVVISPAQTTQKTERKAFRGPPGGKVHFYTYADTAASRTSLFRPEWIAEHFFHDGLHPESVPDWAYNKGHFEHQMTFFIGEVNFHWKQGEKKRVRKMNTGDTNYITPFVPHTFTTRKKGEGVILAVTYGGAIAHEEFQNRIHQMGLEEYVREVEGKLPSINTAVATDDLGGVIVNNASSHKGGETQSGITVLLANVPFQPYSRVLEYVVSSDPCFLHLQSNAEKWGYHLGKVPVTLEWKSHSQLIYPGDSFFIQAGVLHSFKEEGTEEKARLVVMEIQPESSHPLEECALIRRYSSEGLQRIRQETSQWF